MTPLAEQDLVAEVSRRRQVEWFEPLPPELRRRDGADATGLTVAVVDYGVKANILRSLRSRGFRVVVLPHSAGWEQVEAAGADGLLLSNGPGDPAVLDGPVELCRQAIGRIPLFGICLGHQVLGRAIGGSTSRLPFGHHGANHPVKDLETGLVHITSQNHEFQVDAGIDPGGRLLRLSAQPQRRLGGGARAPDAARLQRPVPPRGLPRSPGQPAPLRPLHRDGPDGPAARPHGGRGGGGRRSRGRS